MKAFFALFCSVLFFFTAVLCGAELQFSGTPTEGDSFEFHYLSRDAIQYEINMKEIKPAPSRLETRRIKLSGTLVYLRKTPDKTVIEFTVLGYVRESNGVRADTKVWNGRKINVVTGKNGNTSCSALPRAVTGKMPKGFSAPMMQETEQKTEKLSADLEELMISLFGSAAALPPSAMLGKDGPKKAGEKWPVDVKLICEEMKKFGVKSRPSQWHANAEYARLQDFTGRKVNTVVVNILSDHILGFDGRVDVIYHFSAKDPSKGPLFMSRKIGFVADRAMPEGDPMFAGNLFTVMREHDSEIHMIPLDR